MKWCPSPGCTFAVESNSTRGVPVMCQCGHRFCFSCSSPAHEPVSCHYLQLWVKKCEDDSETAHWIHANTKQCPKCKATIEKSGGCNHMVRNCLSNTPPHRAYPGILGPELFGEGLFWFGTYLGFFSCSYSTFQIKQVSWPVLWVVYGLVGFLCKKWVTT